MVLPPKTIAGLPYTYVVLVDGVERYVGKGRGSRRYEHLNLANIINRQRARGMTVKALKFHNRLAKALRSGARVTTRVLRYYKTDAEAFVGEVRAIAKREGLWNETTGGEGFSSEDRKRFIRELKANPVRWEKFTRAIGLKASERFSSKTEREKVSCRFKQKWSDPVWKEVLLAKRALPEVKAKKAISTKAWYSSDRMRELAKQNGKNSNKTVLWEGRDAFYAAGGGKVIVDSNRRRLQDPEWRERNKQILAEARKRNNADPEFQAKRLAGIRAYWAKEMERRRNGVTS